jgi:hypothetical protein
MLSKAYLGVLVSAITLLISAPMNATSYYCTLKETGRQSGWIAIDMYFHIAPDKQEIVVEDGLMQQFGKDSVNAKVGNSTASSLAFRWSVDTAANSKQRARIEYRANFSEETLKIRVQGNPTGYSNEFEGRGTCKQT